MQEILEGLDGIAGLTDDILVHGKTQEEHDQRLQKALEQGEMPIFGELGEIFGTYYQYGIHPDPEKVLSAIANVPQPKDGGGGGGGGCPVGPPF